MNQQHIRDQAHEDAVAYGTKYPRTNMSGKRLQDHADKEVISFSEWVATQPEGWTKHFGYPPTELTDEDKATYRSAWIASYKSVVEINADMVANPQDYGMEESTQ